MVCAHPNLLPTCLLRRRTILPRWQKDVAECPLPAPRQPLEGLPNLPSTPLETDSHFGRTATGVASSTTRTTILNPKSLRGTARKGLRTSAQKASSCGAGSKSATAA
jgi:hypothetical protein